MDDIATIISKRVRENHDEKQQSSEDLEVERLNGELTELKNNARKQVGTKLMNAMSTNNVEDFLAAFDEFMNISNDKDD